jgi:hypothetical protein
MTGVKGVGVTIDVRSITISVCMASSVTGFAEGAIPQAVSTRRRIKEVNNNLVCVIVSIHSSYSCILMQ